MTTGLSPRRLVPALLLSLIALVELFLAFHGPIALTKTPTLMVAPLDPSVLEAAGLDTAEQEEFIRALEAAFASGGRSSVKPQRFIDEYLAPRGESLQSLADRESVRKIASELGIQRVAQARLASWGGELRLTLSVRDSAAGDLIASENFTGVDSDALLAELDSAAFAEAFAAEVPGMTPFDFSFFLFLGLEILLALLLLMRRGRLFNQAQLIIGSTLFLFALFFARNANMDYVQRFVAHGGALNLAADTARQQLEVSLRFLPLLLLNLGLYLFSGGPRPGAGPGRAIRSNSSPLRGSGISASIPAALARFLVDPPTLLAGWLSGALFAFALPSLLKLDGLPVLAFFALVPLFWSVRRSSAGEAAMGIMAFASLQVMLINFWHATYSYVSLPFTVLLSMAQWLIFLPALLFLVRRPGRLWLLAVPAAWLAFDWLRSMGFLAYPWGMLGTALYGWIPLIQIASVTGVWGLSWLLFLFNAAAVELLGSPRRGLPLLLMVGAIAFPLLFGGAVLLRAEEESGETTRLLLVQHNRDPRKHDYPESVDALLRLSEEGLARAEEEGRPVELVVWPETAFVPDLRYWMRPGNAGRPRRRLAERLFQAVDSWGIPLLTGTSDHKRLPGEEDRDYPEISYNSAALLKPEIGIDGIYHKIRLVPFTEYFPFKEELPGVYAQLDKFDVTEWEPGTEYRVLEHADFSFSTPICFEDIMPDHVRRFIVAGAGAIVNISNDYWSLSSVEGMQHGVNGLFRAVENRIPLVRATTSGLTVGVDPYGRMLGTLPFFEEGALIVDLPRGNPGSTLYSRWGDWFPLLMLLLALAALLGETLRLFRLRRIASELRPRFHFTAPAGWLNDPNGLVYSAGVYHLFYQHDPNPRGRPGFNMHWGHAVSPDLISWEARDPVLKPGPGGRQYWSGSGLLDRENRTGLGTSDNPPLLLYLSRVRLPFLFEQALYYSLDGGESFREYAGNPVIPRRVQGSRDPKVFFHQASRSFCMLLYEKRGFVFLRSENGLQWEETGRLDGFFECPDLFPLERPSDRERGESWVLVDGDGSYLLGDFDGGIFTPRSERLRVEYGPHFYATQVWSNAPGGRRIQLAWMRGGRYPEQVFNQQMSFPCELSLAETSRGLRLRRFPAAELSSRLGPPVPPEKLSGPFLLEASLTDKSVLRLTIYGTPLQVDLQGGEIHFGSRRTRIPLLKISAGTGFRLLVDTASVELFLDGGLVSYSACYLPRRGSPPLAFEDGAKVEVQPILTAPP